MDNLVTDLTDSPVAEMTDLKLEECQHLVVTQVLDLIEIEKVIVIPVIL